MADSAQPTRTTAAEVSGNGLGVVEKSAYTLLPANTTAETVRLDDLNDALRYFFGGKLSFAPLEELQPAAILEMGCGTGSWAIQAAQTFPNARVVAVDQNTMPHHRPLPSNVEFHKLDITQAFPFEDETFDIVHVRFVLMHVPGAIDVLHRAIQLLKPGGWIIIEDPDSGSMVDSGKPLCPGIAAFVESWVELLRSRGVEPNLGQYLEEELRSVGKLAEVHVKKVTVPISGKSDDIEENKLGLAWKVNLVRCANDLPTRYSEQGITPEVVKQVLEELEDPERNITTDMYFSWSSKRRS